MTRQELTAYIESILPADREAMDAARRRQAEWLMAPYARDEGFAFWEVEG